MAKMVTLEIPAEYLHAARMTPDELRRELAVLLFAQERLSLGKASELARLPIADMQALLASRGIGPHYDMQEYEEDLNALKTLRR